MNARGIESSSQAMPHKRQQRVAAGVGEGCPDAMRGGHFGDRADRRVWGDPFTGGMRRHRSELHDAGGMVVDGRRLDRGERPPSGRCLSEE
jgi:hypothetical protein